VSRKPSRRRASLLSIGGFVVVAGLGIWGLVAAILGSGGGTSDAAVLATESTQLPGSSNFPNEWPDPPPPDVAALLGGLGPGMSLDAGWRVRGISPPRERRVVIDVERGEIGFRIWVTAKGAGPGAPPRETQKYALYTVQPRPAQNSVPNEEFGRVLEMVANRIAAQESRVPTPAGL
jgi:hypothetical protein